MKRKEFIKACALFGLANPLLLTFCKEVNIRPSFKGKVIIIGAGAGGLSAGYLLSKSGIEYEIFEASSNYGGRMKINKTFADFTIPLGAEWIETNENIFKNTIGDSSININTIKDGEDYKFINYSWLEFFQDHIIPSISDKIKYNKVVKSINYNEKNIIISTETENTTSDKVIVSVPLKIIKDKDITFNPELPLSKIKSINRLEIWDGYKVFIEFSNKFYDDEFKFNITPKTDGEKIYYDATYGQNTSKNILGLFVVGKPVNDYIFLSENEQINKILSELDNIYDNQASNNYKKHIIQNWRNEKYIKSGYISDFSDWKDVKELGKTVNNKIYFSGGAYTDGEDWVSIHTAIESAKNKVNEIMFSN